MKHLGRVHTLITMARRSLGPFCSSECGAYCCRKGTLNLRPEQVKKVTQGSQDELLKMGRLVLMDQNCALNLNGGCPSLRENHCTIYGSKLRPKACQEYPLFVKEELGRKIIFASPSCPGVQAGKLYPYLRRLKQQGYEIIEPSNIVSLNLHTTEL